MALDSSTLSGITGKAKRISAVLSFIVLLSLVFTACGGGGSTTSSSKSILKIAAQSYDFAQSGFNPYDGHPNAGILGLVYETLYFVNVNDGSFTPMLATSYSWNSDNTQVTFNIRQNVKWNDGQPFTANDVAFTFNLMKQYPAADGLGVWNFLKSVTAPDANTVVMTFQKAYPPVLVNIAGHVYIVPQHIFASVGDPTKYLTDHPVGTGPFTLTRYQTDVAVYDKNPSYWQASNVHVDEIRFPEYKDNATLELALPKGEVDWAGYFSPTLQQDFLAKDTTHNHIFMDAINLYSICEPERSTTRWCGRSADSPGTQYCTRPQPDSGAGDCRSGTSGKLDRSGATNREQMAGPTVCEPIHNCRCHRRSKIPDRRRLHERFRRHLSEERSTPLVHAAQC